MLAALAAVSSSAIAEEAFHASIGVDALYPIGKDVKVRPVDGLTFVKDTASAGLSLFVSPNFGYNISDSFRVGLSGAFTVKKGFSYDMKVTDLKSHRIDAKRDKALKNFANKKGYDSFSKDDKGIPKLDPNGSWLVPDVNTVSPADIADYSKVPPLTPAGLALKQHSDGYMAFLASEKQKEDTERAKMKDPDGIMNLTLVPHAGFVTAGFKFFETDVVSLGGGIGVGATYWTVSMSACGEKEDTNLDSAITLAYKAQLTAGVNLADVATLNLSAGWTGLGTPEFKAKKDSGADDFKTADDDFSSNGLIFGVGVGKDF